MIKKFRLLSFFLVLTMLFSGIAATDAHAGQNNNTSGCEYWDEVHSVDVNKEWNISFNQEIDPSTVNKDSVYVTNHLGQKVNTAATINSNGKTITLQPPSGGYLPDYDYTLHIENILSKQGERQKDNIAMRFFIEDNSIREEVGYRDDVIKLEEAATSLESEHYREISMPLSEFTANNLHEGSIVIIEPSATDIYGYAGKIVSYRTEGENVIISTTEPLFEEMFTHLELKGKQEVSVAQMMNAQLQPGIEARSYREYDPQAQEYIQGVEYIFGAKDGTLTDVGIEYGDFIIKGSVKVENPDIEYDMKTSWNILSGLKLDRFYLAYTADIVSNLEIEYKKSASKNLDQNVTLCRYPVPLGATGLVADLSLDIYADGDIKSSGKVEATLSQKTRIVLGAKQTKNGNMEWVRNTSKDQPEFLSVIETEFKANAEAGISPTVELSYYKIASAGLTGKIGPYLKLDAKATGKGNYADGYFDGKLYAEAGVAFSSTMNLGSAFGVIDKQYSLGRAEIKTWDYTKEYNAESQGQLQSIKFSAASMNIDPGGSEKLEIVGVYKNNITGNTFEAPISNGVTYTLNPTGSASIDNSGNIKILTAENREIDVFAEHKGKKASILVSVTAEAVDKTDLQTAIATARSKHDSAVEGSNAGQYAYGSKATFQAAIETAQIVADDVKASQVVVDRATSDLAAAEAAFYASQITTLDILPGDTYEFICLSNQKIDFIYDGEHESIKYAYFSNQSINSGTASGYIPLSKGNRIVVYVKSGFVKYSSDWSKFIINKLNRPALIQKHLYTGDSSIFMVYSNESSLDYPFYTTHLNLKILTPEATVLVKKFNAEGKVISSDSKIYKGGVWWPLRLGESSEITVIDGEVIAFGSYEHFSPGGVVDGEAPIEVIGGVTVRSITNEKELEGLRDLNNDKSLDAGAKINIYINEVRPETIKGKAKYMYLSWYKTKFDTDKELLPFMESILEKVVHFAPAFGSNNDEWMYMPTGQGEFYFLVVFLDENKNIVGFYQNDAPITIEALKHKGAVQEY